MTRKFLDSRWLPTLFFVAAGLSAVVTILLLLSACSTSTNAPSDPTPTIQPLEDQVDQAVDNDGTPLQIPTAGPNYYPDAYALVMADCTTMTNQGSEAQNWLAEHLTSEYAVPGETAALKVGVPLVCPQFTATVNSIEGGR
jgi:hypothetical protein